MTGVQDTTMAIQIVSDLHLETPKAYDVFEIEPKAPVLALVGDIGNTTPSHRADLAGFLARQRRQFRAVLYVPGNHEAYHSTWPETLATLRAMEEEVASPTVGRLVVLDRGRFDVPGTSTVVLGCRLFSHVPPAATDAVELGVNDFYQTGDGWDVAAHNAAHARDVAWLNAQVAAVEEGRDVVILTHWSPSMDARASDPRHAASTISNAFATDLSAEPCFRSPRVRAWVFGHTHYNCDFTVDRGPDVPPLHLVANQRGYYFAQAAGFDAGKTI